jgi:tRNA G18 (ribose-2'-O)-methylase SpoU
MPIARLADPSDPRIAVYHDIRDPHALEARGLFVAEGRLVVRRLLQDSRFRAVSVLASPTALESLRDVLDGARSPLDVFVLPKPAISNVVAYPMHQGCLALGDRRPVDPWDAARIARDASLIVALERVGNPDNMGAAFRNAAAFGADAVLLSPGCGDPLYRKAIRTSMGSALRVPFAEGAEWPADVERLRAAGITIVALTPDARARDLQTLWEDGRPRPARVALLVGTEGAGLSAEAIALAEVCVRIPILPAVDSLNLATATGIALHHLRRDPRS